MASRQASVGLEIDQGDPDVVVSEKKMRGKEYERSPGGCRDIGGSRDFAEVEVAGKLFPSINHDVLLPLP